MVRLCQDYYVDGDTHLQHVGKSGQVSDEALQVVDTIYLEHDQHEAITLQIPIKQFR